MKRGESAAVIYLSLLVCLTLGQSTEGKGALTHLATYVEAGALGGICLPWNISSLTSFTCN